MWGPAPAPQTQYGPRATYKLTYRRRLSGVPCCLRQAGVQMKEKTFDVFTAVVINHKPPIKCQLVPCRFFLCTEQSRGGATKVKQQWAPFISLTLRLHTGFRVQSWKLHRNHRKMPKAATKRERSRALTHRGAKSFIKLHLWLYRAVKRRRIINAGLQTDQETEPGMDVVEFGVSVYMCVRVCVYDGAAD